MKTRQNGFTVIEGLLLALVLAVVGFGGYYVWHSQKTTTTTKPAAAVAQTTTDTQKKEDTTPQMQYLKITEYGIKLPLTDQISDLTYVASEPFGGKVQVVTIESGSKLGNLYHQFDSECDTASKAVDLYGQWLTPNAPGINQTAHATATVNGTTYYMYAKGATGGCDSGGPANPTAAQQAQIDAYMNAVYSAVNKAVAL